MHLCAPHQAVIVDLVILVLLLFPFALLALLGGDSVCLVSGGCHAAARGMNPWQCVGLDCCDYRAL